jgi:3-oxoacyl-[acyl-carrier protein] reductase
MSSNLSMPKQLLHQTAYITGASRGIGLRIAETLAEAGAHVVLGARSKESVEAVAEGIRQRGGKADGLKLDVSGRDSCEAFVVEARKVAGPPSILINNAGMGIFRPVDEFLPDEFEQQFRTNVFGPYYMMHFCISLMKQVGRGHIVNISSLAGKNAAVYGSAYYATKWALQGMSKCVFEEIRQQGLKLTTVLPGSVDTRFHVDSHPNSHEKDQGWMVRPEDVAQTVLNVLLLPGNALISEVEVRPTQKP